LFQNNSNSPYFQIQFQRPSYILEKENSDKIIYYCDDSKEECKINFNLTNLTGKNLSSTLNCEIKTDFESEQFVRCNPNTVIFPKGINVLNIKVTSKKNAENFSERKIIIVNGEFNEEEIDEAKSELLAPSGLPPSPPKGESIIKKPVYSGEVVVRELISGEVKVREKTIAKVASPHSVSPLGERSSTKIVNIPEFKYLFQRPSYVLETSEEDKYICDNSK